MVALITPKLNSLKMGATFRENFKFTSHTPCMYILQGCYRLGAAYEGLNQHEDAMVAYAEGILAAGSKQESMLHGLTEAVMRSPYRGE